MPSIPAESLMCLLTPQQGLTQAVRLDRATPDLYNSHPQFFGSPLVGGGVPGKGCWCLSHIDLVFSSRPSAGPEWERRAGDRNSPGQRLSGSKHRADKGQVRPLEIPACCGYPPGDCCLPRLINSRVTVESLSPQSVGAF